MGDLAVQPVEVRRAEFCADWSLVKLDLEVRGPDGSGVVDH